VESILKNHSKFILEMNKYSALLLGYKIKFVTLIMSLNHGCHWQ